MTQSHQHTPSDKSTAELGSRKDQLNWSGFSGLSQIERMARFYSGFRCLSRPPVRSLEESDTLYVRVILIFDRLLKR